MRDADLSLEVVLIQRKAGVCYSLPWLADGYGGQQVDFLQGIEEDVARAVATCTVSLPSWMTRGNALDRVLDDLERNGIESWQRSIWLRGVLPLVLDGIVRDGMTAAAAGLAGAGLAAWRLVHAGHGVLGGCLAASLTGAMVVGGVSSVFDAPRVATLFWFCLLFVLCWTKRVQPGTGPEAIAKGV